MNRMREIGRKEEEGRGKRGAFFATWNWEKGKGVALCLMQCGALQSAVNAGLQHTSLRLP